MRQARVASTTGQSAQPTAEPKRRGLPCAGFATTYITHAQRTLKVSNAPLDFRHVHATWNYPMPRSKPESSGLSSWCSSP
jgi:hypothetical protein